MRTSPVLRVAVCVALVCSIVIASPPGVAEATGSGWHWLNPVPRGESLNGIDMVDANVGYAVGNIGCLMKTYDGGKSWVAKSSGTTEDLHAVAFIDSDTGWVGGENGVILKTDGTGGATWVKQTTNVTDGEISAIHFRDVNKGWATDNAGRIFRTTDGGTTWQHTPIADYLTSIYFTSDLVGFAVSSSGIVYKSTDGGVTWPTTQLLPGNALSDITFKPGSDQIGWIVAQVPGVNSAYKTTNGGGSWTPVGDAALGWWYSVSYAPSSDTLWVVGMNAQPDEIARVTDGATPTWDAMSYASYGNDSILKGVDSVSAERAVAVGDLGVVTRTPDGGTTWLDRDQKIGRSWLYSVQFLDDRTGYIGAGDGGVWKSTDAGKTWTNTSPGNTSTIHDVHFLDRFTGWAVGVSGKILKTTDGGATWIPQVSGVNQLLTAVHFVDASHGWVVSEQGWVLATDNGGTSWARQGEGVITTAELTDVEFRSTTEGAAVGTGGRVYVTSDGGATWTAAANHGGGGTWYSVEYVAPGTFFVAGDNMAGFLTNFSLVKFTNGGANYSPMPSDPAVKSTFTGHATVFAVEFLDANRGWAAFQDGYIGTTTDGGFTWTYERVMDNAIRALCVLPSGAAWASAPSGRLVSNCDFSPTTVYRFYRPSTGTHFYTADVSEKHYIISNLSSIYTYEGAGYVYDPYYANTLLYRFFRPSTGTHFFTADPTERDYVINNLGGLFTYEGPVYSISGTPPAGVPYSTVYRFYRPKSGTHFYTADTAERDNVISTLGATYAYEGPVYYLPQ